MWLNKGAPHIQNTKVHSSLCQKMKLGDHYTLLDLYAKLQNRIGVCMYMLIIKLIDKKKVKKKKKKASIQVLSLSILFKLDADC